jgi:gamma-glutamyltranspeptidase
MESGFSPAVKAELEKRGYKVVPGTGSFGGYQAIMSTPSNTCIGARARCARTAKR